MNIVTWSILGLIVVLLAAVWYEWRRQQPDVVPDAVTSIRRRNLNTTIIAPTGVYARVYVDCLECGQQFHPQTPPGKRPFVRHYGVDEHEVGFAGPDESEPVEQPEPVSDVPAPAKHSRDIFGRVGADAHWAEELALVGDGQLLPEGIPTVSIDEIPDAELIRPGTPTVSIDDFTDEELWEASFGADLRRVDNALEEARRLCTRNLMAAGIPLAVMQEIDRRDLDAHERAVDHATVLTTTEFPVAPARSSHRPTIAQARRARKRERRQAGSR